MARHKKAREGLTARQKRVLRAGAVAAPLSAGFMLSVVTSASADEQQQAQQQVQAQPTADQPATASAQGPDSWTKPGGALTPEQINRRMYDNYRIPERASYSKNEEENHRVACYYMNHYSLNTCQDSGGELNPEKSFGRIKGPDYYGNEQVTEGTLMQLSEKETIGEKVTTTNEFSGEVSLAAPIKYVGAKVGGKHAVAREQAPPERTYGLSRTQSVSFNPGMDGAHQVLVDPTAHYNPLSYGYTDQYGRRVTFAETKGFHATGNGGQPIHALEKNGPTAQAPAVLSDEQSEPQSPANKGSNENPRFYPFHEANPYSPQYHGRNPFLQDPLWNVDDHYNYATGKYDQGSYRQWAKEHVGTFPWRGDEANPYSPHFHNRGNPFLPELGSGYSTSPFSNPIQRIQGKEYNFETQEYEYGGDLYQKWREQHPEMYPSDYQG